jgi:hypothetical protein
MTRRRTSQVAAGLVAALAVAVTVASRNLF